MDAVEARDLVVDRAGRRVLDGLSFTVRAGRVTGLLGPSGSGKTTLMRALVGTQTVRRSSRVRVLGRPAGSPELRRRVGYVTQAPSVYGDLTVAQNVRYFAALYGLGGAAARRAVADVDLTGFADRPVVKLSGGQRARASLACALVAGPDLLVLDEPTVGLDPVLRRDLWALFRGLADRGATLLVSSHVMDEAAHCDRLLLMREGVLLADDTQQGLLDRTGAVDVEAAFLALVDRAAAHEAGTAAVRPLDDQTSGSPA
jgi:ABC-2 type transport system ATP-binding protein